MSTRTRIASLVTAAGVIAAALIGSAAPADAATPHPGNVLEHACSSSHRVECLETPHAGADRIVIRGPHGGRHTYRGHAAILRGLERWAAPCQAEDGTACYWDATRHGNGRGWSFIVSGHGRPVYLRTL